MTPDLDFCDIHHPPIAFFGRCPICQARAEMRGVMTVAPNIVAYRSDLDRALRAHYAREGDRRAFGVLLKDSVVTP